MWVTLCACLTQIHLPGDTSKCHINCSIAASEGQPVYVRVCVFVGGGAQCQPRGWVKGCRLSVCRGDLGQCNLSCYPPSATQVLFCLDLSHHLSPYSSGTPAWHRIQTPFKVFRAPGRRGRGWLLWSPTSPDHILVCVAAVLVQRQGQQPPVLALDLDVGCPEGVCHHLQQRQLRERHLGNRQPSQHLLPSSWGPPSLFLQVTLEQ